MSAVATPRAVAVLIALASITCGGRPGAGRPLMTSDPDVWVQTNGPAGGRISDLVIDPLDPARLYAVGSPEGVYCSTDAGLTWTQEPYGDEPLAGPDAIGIHPSDPSVLLVASESAFLRSADGGAAWQSLAGSVDPCTGSVDIITFSAFEPGSVYAAGSSHCHDTDATVQHSSDGGVTWENVGAGLGLPHGVSIASVSVGAGGRLAAAANDHAFTSWRRGQLFLSDDAGDTWSEIDYGGQTEDRFIWSVFINPYEPDQIWVTEAPLFNEPIGEPCVYRSDDGGVTWTPVFIDVPLDDTQRRMLGAAPDGRVFIAGGGNLAVTADGGASFTDISLPAEIVRFDLYHLAVHPRDPNKLYLPTGAGGVAYSADGGVTWTLRNEGIIATNINLLATDPLDPGVVYAASAGGEGTFRSDDYGATWALLNSGGINHPWGDELVVDPQNPNDVWFVADVPYVYRSRDRGESWDTAAHPYEGESLNFSSIYAVAQADDPSVVYALSNGFGIFKAQRGHGSFWDWRFLRASEVDYTYSLAVEPGDARVLYSGYSRKPFETGAKVRATHDGGDTWFTGLEIDGAEAVTSVAVDPSIPARVYAASVGDSSGADLWVSEDKGHSWQALGRPFSFTTIHSHAVSGDGCTAFAGVWGGGTYRTSDGGDAWVKLTASEAFSAAALALGPSVSAAGPPVLYLADRTSPVLYRSVDSGDSFTALFDAGPEYRRLMNVTVDPTDPGRLYVAAMKRGGLGKLGSLFRLDGGVATDVTGSLPKLVLSATVDPEAPTTVYAVLHESGVYRSADAGATWSEISGTGSGLPDSGFLGLICHPVDASRLYLFGGCDVRFATVASAGLDPDRVHGVYRSTDGGVSWQNLNGGVLGAASGAVKSLSFDPGDPDHLTLAAENGCYRSRDGGDTWMRDTGFPYGPAAGIALGGGKALAFTNGAGVYRGTLAGDGSIGWEPTPQVCAGVAFAQVVPHPSDAGVLYATGYPGGVFKSMDGGQTWHEKNFGMVSFGVADPLRQGYYALDISRSDPRVLYLGLYGKGVYRSGNSAETWQPMYGSSMELYGAQVTALAVDRQDPDVVTVAAEEGMYQTIDGGLTWQSMQVGLPTADIRVLHTNAANELFAGTRGYGVYEWEEDRWETRSPVGNWGVTWPMWDDRPLYQYTSLLIHPEDSSRMLMGTFPQGIYASRDGGQTWRESNVGWTNDGVFSLVTRPDNAEIVYAGTYNGVNRSLDYGGSWEMWDSGMPAEQWVFSIDFDPGDPRVMYACSKNGEDEGRGRDGFRGTVMKSVNGGGSWFEITTGLDLGQEFYKIIADRFGPNTLYLAAQEDGMLISRDGGVSWSRWNEGLTNVKPGTNGNNVTSTLEMSADGSVLYFGTAGSGVFRRAIAPILPVHHLSASVDAERITLTWRFDDLNGNFGAYSIYRSTEAIASLDGLAPIGSSTFVADTTFGDADVARGQSYYYVVTTIDEEGFENRRATALGPVILRSGKPGDFNGDAAVDFGDFYLFADQFGSAEGDAGYDAAFDLTGDGRVDFSDLWEFADVFGT